MGKENVLMAQQLFAKIIVREGYFSGERHVIYFRDKLTPISATEHRGYFEWLCALVKVAHPKWRVELYIGLQDCLNGEEYIAWKTKNLLKVKRKKLKLVEAEVPEYDLFGISRKEYEERLAALREAVADLEAGRFKYYVPASYINRIREFIKQ